MAVVRIPEGITVDIFYELKKELVTILKELEKVAGVRHVVNLRLNKTGKDKLHPYFVGWVEDEEARKKREENKRLDPGLVRFGYDNKTDVYTEAIKKTLNKDLYPYVIRNCVVDAKKYYHYDTSINSGINFQLFTGITANVDGSTGRVCVGMLGIGVDDKPDPQKVDDLKKLLKKWAQDDPKSLLVSFLESKLELSSPSSAVYNYQTPDYIIPTAVV